MSWKELAQSKRKDNTNPVKIPRCQAKISVLKSRFPLFLYRYWVLQASKKLYYSSKKNSLTTILQFIFQNYIPKACEYLTVPYGNWGLNGKTI